MKLFFGRFFSQQFKRTTLPPGRKSERGVCPRGDWRMPDEATADALIAGIDAL
jgi:NAD+ synthase (glutamine-hydrolysing)